MILAGSCAQLNIVLCKKNVKHFYPPLCCMTEAFFLHAIHCKKAKFENQKLDFRFSRYIIKLFMKI